MRQLMRRDLEGRFLPGMSRAEVLELLGPSQPLFRDIPDDCVMYELGPEPHSGIDREWLVLFFNGKGIYWYSSILTD
jgi:hypothetical protein